MYGKSTIFNNLTGMHQHTGNWTGKTVNNAYGICTYQNNNYLFVDLPGTYSIMSNSEEEEIARDYICFGKPDITIIVVDATTLERNLNLVYQILEITPNVIVCVNLLDEAKKKNININLNKLEKILGIPVIGTTARNKKTLINLMKKINNTCTKKQSSPKSIKYFETLENSINILEPVIKKEYKKDVSPYLSRWLSIKLIENNQNMINSIERNLNINLSENINVQHALKEAKTILVNNNISFFDLKEILATSSIKQAEKTAKKVCSFSNKDYSKRDRRIDKIITSKLTSFPIMLIFLGLIFWLTIVVANYPSKWLSFLFTKLEIILLNTLKILNTPQWIIELLINGLYKTLTWVISVMLPPMAIFFPFFTLLEDLGFLPRLSFNLDNLFKKCGSSGKQALPMCMGFGCNAAGIVGARIISSKKEKLIAILTNSFVPCNRAFSFFDFHIIIIYSN